MNDLESTNKNLAETCDQLLAENQALRLKLFNMNTLYQQKLSEITVDKLANKFSEVLSGVIRKAQGAVD